MARKAILTDGTRTVNLIDITTIIPQRGAFGKARYSPHQYDAARVVDDMLFVETWKLNIYGTSHDNLATQTALFKALLRDAWRYHNAEFDKPVYLEVRTDDETNTRFATVWLCPEISDPDFFTHPFALDNAIEGQGVNIARFAWESLPQGIRGNRILQTASIGPDYSPDTTDYDVDLTGEDGQLPVTMTGGLIGRPGAFGRAVQVGEATTNHVLNPSAEAAGNFAALGAAAVAQNTDQELFGLNSFRVITTAAANDGMSLTLNALANAIHYVTIRSYAALTDWQWSLDAPGVGTWNAMATIGTEDGWFVYGFEFPAAEANASVLLSLRHTDASIVTVYFDAAQVEQLVYPTCYCDGSLGPGHAWAGAAHASTSTRTAHVLRYDISDCSTKGTVGFRMMPIYEEDETPNWAWPISLSDGTANNAVEFQLAPAANVYRAVYYANAVADIVQCIAGDVVRLTNAHVVMTWDTSADEFKLYIDGVQIGTTQTGLGTPSGAWDRLYVGADRAAGNLWSGWIDDLFVLSGVVLSDTEVALLHASSKKFTGHKATDLYLDFDGPKFNHLANFRDDIAIDEVWMYDGAWNDIGPDNNEYTWFPAVAQDDALYWGSTDNAFKHITGFFRVAGDLTTTTLVLEYSDGAAWNDYAALVLGTDYTLYSADDLETFCERTGNYAINIKPPADWVANDPSNGGGGVAARYIRLRESNAAPAYAVNPVHGGQGTFTPRDNYIEVPSTVLGGDAKAKLLLRNRTPTGGDETKGFANASRILIGAKENPGTFVMSLNAELDNPAGWATTDVTDAANVADQEAPGGEHCEVDFAVTEPMAVRLRITGTNKLEDWIGEYRAMLRCQQIGGAAGDVSVKLVVLIGSTDAYAPKFETKTIALEGLAQGQEQVALSTNEPGGTVKIPWLETKSIDNFADTNIYFEIWASVVTGSAAVLRIYCLDLLPVKNWAVELDDPVGDTTYGSTALRGDNCIDIDAGLITDRTGKMINALANPVPVETWTRGGPPPQLNPETQVKMYFVNMHYPVTSTPDDEWGEGPLLATLGMHLTAELWSHNQYYALRGND